MSIKGKVALVTGSSRGLGRAIALKLAKAGSKLAVCARDDRALKDLVDVIETAGGEAIYGAFSISDYKQLEQFVTQIQSRFGRLDILVNNAGLGWYKPFVEYSIEEIDQTIDVNLRGLIYATKAVLPIMLAQKHGQVINIASDLGRRVIPNMAPYVAAKHGVMGFAGSLLREVKDQGIKVMTMTPGIIDTYFGGGEAGSRDETWSLQPEAVAELVLNMLTLPQYTMLDEVSIHPMHQEM